MKEFLHHGAELLPSSHADIIKKKREDRSLNNEADVAISWRLLRGRNLDEGSKLMLSRAVAIFHVSNLLRLFDAKIAFLLAYFS